MRKISLSAVLALLMGVSISVAQTETTCTSTLVDRVNFLNSGDVTQNVKMRQSWDCPPVSENDKYGFTLDWEGPAKPIWMADPTIVWVKGSSQSEGWYYITGTCDELGAGNFQIYKTKDFRHYFTHKKAFTDAYKPNDNEDRLLMPKPLQSGVNYIYGGLYSPHLFIDPANPDEVHILFTATRAETLSSYGGSSPPTYSQIKKVWHYDPARSCNDNDKLNPIFPWDSWWESLDTGSDFDESAWWDRIIDCNTSNSEALLRSPQVIFEANRFQAMFVASMPVNDFVDPSDSETFSSGDRNVRWLGYREPSAQGNAIYDGGQQLNASGGNRYVPSYANAYSINNCDTDGTNLESMSATGTFGGYLPFGTWHRVINHSPLSLWAPFTSMVDGGCVFFDPNDSSNCSAFQGWIFYGWQCIGADADQNGGLRGNHIAGAKLLRCLSSSSVYNNDWEFGTAIESAPTGFNTRSSLSQFACRINSNNAPPNQTYNGQSTSGATAHAPGWGVAESPSVVWDDSLASGGRYVLSLSRNFWDSPAYCVVYRTAANASSGVKALRLDTITDSTTTEYMLASSNLYAGGTTYNLRGVAYGRSYGSAEFFYFRKPDGCYVVDSNGQKMLGIIFHAKLDGESRRTVFFKNLVRSNGLYSELIENHPSGAAGTDTWKFQVPKYCFADFNKDGFVNGADYDDFVDAYDTGDPSANINEDTFVNPDDFDFFALCFDEGC